MGNFGVSNINFGNVKDTPTIGTSAQNLNNAAYYYAVSFVLPETKTLNTVRHRCSNVVGTVASTDIEVSIHPPDAGNDCDESTVLDTSTDSTMSGTGAQTVTWTGLDYELTAGTRYFLMWKNTNGTPASNYCTMLTGLGASGAASVGSSSSDWGFIKQATVNGGSSWSTLANVMPIYRLGFDDSTFQGFPIVAVNQSSVSEGVYAARQAGVYFQMFGNASINLTHVSAVISRTGTPTEALSAKIYEGSTLVATSANSVDASVVSTVGTNLSFIFTTAVKMKAGVYYRVAFAEAAQSDASTDRYNILYTEFDSDGDSAGLVPMGGTWAHTYYNTTWGQTAVYVPQMQFTGDYDTPLANVTRGFGGV